jgi:uncharacterized protein YqjF (DUF2071 family)
VRERPDAATPTTLCAVQCGPLERSLSTSLTTVPRPFLTAEWRHLILANYAVDPALLAPHLPPGLELDLFEGQPHVSLVAFDFRNTRVLGIRWPGHRDFPEINLRFYVRDGDQRGVVFVREYVPKPAIAGIARWLYNEPYRCAPMRSQVTEGPEELRVEHWLTVAGRESRLRVVAHPSSSTPPEGGEAHFFKEHSWGHGTSRKGTRLTYEVAHPVWATHEVRKVEMDWDWASIYGEEWAHLADQEPRSVFLASGSEVSVSPKQA